ncbi:DUF1349 domain-containing protein [Zavarzinella formosa]|uniref:DUF1349 domain-containing protein n=1 Tax=Zavarzinella formosa TaxID=360055 RepID=UPI0002F95D3E|nr:DUF1349 domain-containing protein [Zavarzinella formosa]
MKPLSLLFVGVLCAVTIAAPAPKGLAPVHDDFDGKLTLDWKVIRPDPTHVSLKKVPGSLVITTQRGSIHGKEKEDAVSEGTQAKNIHLIEIPFAKEADWVTTTCVNGFEPDTSYQQAGLIVYTDDDNYLKWNYEFDWAKGSGQRFIAVVETAGEPTHIIPQANDSGLKKYWLRLTKRGNKYAFDWSPDGDKWTPGGESTWGDGHPKRVGLIAKNGGNKEAPERDAAFEFFDLKVVKGVKK